MSIRRSSVPFLSILLVLTTALWACGGGDDPTDPGDNGGNGGGDVTVINLTGALTFSPDDVTISPGTTVRWVNQTNLEHTVTPDGHSEWTEWETTASGQEFEHTFGTTGTFEYFCEPHLANGMTGVIRVE